jgi:hypothetical protein
MHVLRDRSPSSRNRWLPLLRTGAWPDATPERINRVGTAEESRTGDATGPSGRGKPTKHLNSFFRWNQAGERISNEGNGELTARLIEGRFLCSRVRPREATHSCDPGAEMEKIEDWRFSSKCQRTYARTSLNPRPGPSKSRASRYSSKFASRRQDGSRFLAETTSFRGHCPREFQLPRVSFAHRWNERAFPQVERGQSDPLIK